MNEFEDGIQIFAVESGELLEDMESGLLALEDQPGDQEAINSLFRAVHTIKGSAGIVGLDDIERFSHTVEELLDKVREGEIGVTDPLIAVLLRCRDHMSELVKVTLSGQVAPAELLSREFGLVTELREFYTDAPGAGIGAAAGEVEAAPATAQMPGDEDDGSPRAGSDHWHISLRFGLDVMRNGMDPISFISYLDKVGRVTSLTTMTGGLPGSLDAMDPESCYLGFEISLESDLDKQSIEDVFEFVRDDCAIRILPPGARIKSYVGLIGSLPEDPLRLGEILVESGTLTRRELEEALREQGLEGGPEELQAPLGQILLKERVVHEPVIRAALDKQKESANARVKERKTIRVDTEKLDQLINMVGELVISGASIAQHSKRIQDKQLLQSVHMMTRLIEEIREGSMRVRMIPLHDTFNRFKRVLHDISHGLGKEIDLIVMGGDTEMDKNVIERIKDPLMHIVRNAGDHGIEPPEERRAAGKPAQGTVRLNAYQDTSDIVIEIADDGKGLDREALLNKAIAMGLAEEGIPYTDQDVYGFLFAPGFSTAETVTNISGRGVGMDVVRRNIEALRGTVEVESAFGAGTTIRIRLPLTLAIIEGFLVSIADSYYVIPMDTVVECLELTKRDRRESHGRNHVNLRGDILPYIRLGEMFGHAAGGDRKRKSEYIVVVRYAGHVTGLLVERLYGEIQAVIKDLGRVYRDIRGLSGATIMGDGTVALVLDVKTLVNVALEAEDARYTGRSGRSGT